MGESSFQHRLQQQRSRCVRQGKNYTNRVTWWERYAKKKIRYLFIQEGTERIREAAINDHFYYACIYDVLKDFNHHREKEATLNLLKAKTVRLYSKRLQSITVDRNDHTLLQGNRLSLFHLLRMSTRATRMITNLLDKDGDIQTTTKAYCTPS